MIMTQTSNEEFDKEGFFKKMKKFAGKIPFTKDALSMYYCAIDSKTPLYVKGIAFGALAYFISPMDAIPDALVGMGMVDDATVIYTALKTVGKHVNDEHREKAEKFFEKE
jgi:uncharacterized membrane protein YkvA (DUF1232 family)